MLNLELVDKLLLLVVAAISFSQVCWQVFSPGAEINQNSVMIAYYVVISNQDLTVKKRKIQDVRSEAMPGMERKHVKS